MFSIDRYWYRSSYSFFTVVLLPFSWLFKVIVACRRFFYKKKIFKSYSFSVPIIVVGNITVGGTGKTPMVIWLVQWLKNKGYRPGIVSRGMGGQRQAMPRWVTPTSLPCTVGDEAVLLAKRTDVPMVIGVDRVAAVRELLKKSCDVVISDDGLQHYRLARDIEIVMVDSARGLGNQLFLPAGPLRESPSRLNEVDFVVGKHIGFPMELIGHTLVKVNDVHQHMPLDNLRGKTVHAVAAIGNPQRFFASLREKGIHVIEHIFPDHYLYRLSDVNFKDDLLVVMTEKDAVKCQDFGNDALWFLPVETRMPMEFEERLLEKLNNLR